MTGTVIAAAGAAAAHGPGWAGNGPPPFAPFGVAMFCLLLFGLIAFAVFAFLRTRRHGRPPWAGPMGGGPMGGGPFAEPPEYAARRILSERFAQGDLTVEEFIERASALNWNPGQEGKGRR